MLGISSLYSEKLKLISLFWRTNQITSHEAYVDHNTFTNWARAVRASSALVDRLLPRFTVVTMTPCPVHSRQPIGGHRSDRRHAHHHSHWIKLIPTKLNIFLLSWCWSCFLFLFQIVHTLLPLIETFLMVLLVNNKIKFMSLLINNFLFNLKIKISFMWDSYNKLKY